MTTQPEALRLADQLEDTESARLHLLPYAAAELRRLHEAHAWQHTMAGERLRRIEKDEVLMRQALEALERLGGHDDRCDVFDLDDEGRHKDCSCGVQSTIAALRERLGVSNE